MNTDKQRKNSDNLKPFKPGQSGNPKGRPKKENCIPDILRMIGEEIAKDKAGNPISGEAGEMNKREFVLRKVFDFAVKGQSWAVQFIAERTEGKVSDKLQLDTGTEEMIIKILRSDEYPPTSETG